MRDNFNGAKYDYMCTYSMQKSLLLIIVVPAFMILLGCVWCITYNCDKRCRERGLQDARTFTSTRSSLKQDYRDTDNEGTELTKRALNAEKEEFRDN
jgi:hypothetical protein